MKYQKALIAWTPGTDLIRVGSLLEHDDLDWTEHPIRYLFTGGAATTWLRACKDKSKRDLFLFIEFNTIVVRDKVPVDAAHRAFLNIDEYRERIAADTPGVPNVPPSHADDCDWHLDQYPWECTCGAIPKEELKKRFPYRFPDA